MRRTFSNSTLHFFDVFMRLPPKVTTKIQIKSHRVEKGFCCVNCSLSELLLKMANSLKSPEILSRIQIIIEKGEPIMFYRSHLHKKIFTHLLEKLTLDKPLSKQMLAVLFLLTADSQLWSRARNAVKEQGIRFDQISLKGLEGGESERYALLKAAKSLYFNNNDITISDLSDESAISDTTLRTIMNAFALRRYGVKALNVQK